MRIPSQFSDESLFQRGGKPGGAVRSIRPLFRLGLMLVLVIFVMRIGAQEKIYEPFFPSPTSPRFPNAGFSAAETLALESTALHDPSQRVSPSGGASSASSADLADWIASQLPREVQVQWSLSMTDQRRGRPESDRLATTRSALANLVGDIHLAPVEDSVVRQAWQEFLRSQGESNQNGIALSDSDLDKVMAMQNALLRAALDRVVDGSVWRAADKDALLLLLDRIPRPSDTTAKAETLALFSGAARATVVPLLQQPDHFRGRTVLIDAEVVRADRIEKLDDASDFVVPGYWQLWLQPRSGVQRPVVAIVSRLPPRIAHYADDPSGPQPRVTVAGYFLKRLAYQSSIGADLAPVVVGDVWSAESSVDQDKSASESLPTGTRWIGVIVCASIIVGVGLAGLLMWGSRRSASRLRSQRLARQSPQLSFVADPNDQALSSDAVEAP